MSKNLTRKGLAFGAGMALVATGLAAMPAQAAAGDVNIVPDSGTGLSAFTTDKFAFQTNLSGLVAETTLSYRIDNPDQHELWIDTEGSNAADIIGIKADGSATVANALGNNVALAGTGIVVDFEELDIVSLLIVDIAGVDKTAELYVQLAEDNVAGASVEAVDPLEYADISNDVDITVTSWIETKASPSTTGTTASASDYGVDAEFSSSATVTFVNPSSVVPISAVERMAQVDELGAGFTTLNDVLFVDGVRSAADIETKVPDEDDGLVDTQQDTTLTVGDVILALDADGDDSAEVGIYTAGVDGATTSDLDDLTGQTIVDLATGNVYTGAAQNATLSTSVTASGFAQISSVITKILYVNDPVIIAVPAAGDDTDIDAGNTKLAATDVALIVDTNDGSKTAVYDIAADGTGPDVDIAGSQLIVADMFNNTGDAALVGSLRFSNPSINLAQVDLAKWLVEVESSTTDGRPQADLADSVVSFVPNGYAATDGLGRLVYSVEVGSLAKSATYNVAIAHDGASTVEYKSPGFQVIAGVANDANNVAATVEDSTNVNIAAVDTGAYPTTVRNGTAAVKFDGQVYSAADTETKKANIPFLAVVTAGATFPTGATLSVTGTNQRVATSNGSVVTSGVSDSDGQFSVTVTSSDTSAAGTKYDVQFYVLDTTSDLWLTAHDNSGSALYKVDYASAAIAATDGFGTATTVASGSSVTLTFDLVDQFGEALSETATGKAYSVELSAPDTDNLELYGQIVDGSVVFTFDNYLTEGTSDVLSAKLYTGTSTSPSASDFVSGKTDTITLYNTNAAVGINVTDEVTGVVVNYTDFFDGKPGAGDTVPTATKGTITGTVVDANGAGVPGAPVTIAADGFAFEVAGTYATGSMDIIANASGAFEVDFWTTVLTGATGVDVAITSGTLSAETNVVTELPGTLTTGNVRLSWTVPATVVSNTTYAVAASLTDIWGNPIAGEKLHFNGLAAAQFNSLAEAERTTGPDGTAIAYLRSIKDVDGLAAISVSLLNADKALTYDVNVGNILKDVATTSWDESAWGNVLSQEINFLDTAPAASSTQKVNAGSFKGYVALYALGYEGQRMSAKVGNDWVIVPSVPAATNDLFRAVEFVGAGVDISVRIYIDRVLVATIPLLTK